MTVDGKSVTDSIGIANSMNKSFCDVGNVLSKNIPDTKNGLLKGENIINPTNATFIFSPVTPEQLILPINRFKTSNGLQGINYHLMLQKTNSMVIGRR